MTSENFPIIFEFFFSFLLSNQFAELIEHEKETRKNVLQLKI